MTREMAINILRGAVLGINEQTHEAVFMAIKALKEQERVDAVEVVRCKDCKWHRTGEFYALGNDRVPYETISSCLKWHDDVPVDFYCGWGERIEDGKNG